MEGKDAFGVVKIGPSFTEINRTVSSVHRAAKGSVGLVTSLTLNSDFSRMVQIIAIRASQDGKGSR